MDLISDYERKLDRYINNSQNNSHILEIQKCCGYSEFILCYKESTLRELYANVYYQFQINSDEHPIRLFIVNGETNPKTKTILPISDEKLRDFIRNNVEILKRIYPFPCKVVYKFHIDDGNCTKHSPDDFCYFHN